MNDNRLFNPFGDLPEMPSNRGNDDGDGGEMKVLSAICTFMASVAIVILMILLLWFFGSCTTVKYVPVIETKTDTLRQTIVQRDSLYLHDSIYVHEYVKGDTVRITTDRWHTAYRDRWQHDTTYISRTDSVPKPYPVTEYVERQLTWWQRTQMYAGDLLLLMLLGSLLWLVVIRRR